MQLLTYFITTQFWCFIAVDSSWPQLMAVCHFIIIFSFFEQRRRICTVRYQYISLLCIKSSRLVNVVNTDLITDTRITKQRFDKKSLFVYNIQFTDFELNHRNPWTKSSCVCFWRWDSKKAQVKFTAVNPIECKDPHHIQHAHSSWSL